MVLKNRLSSLIVERKTKPVCFCRIKKTVKGVLEERFLEGFRFHLHVYASIREDIAQLVLEDVNNRNTFLLAYITFSEQVSDFEYFEKS